MAIIQRFRGDTKGLVATIKDKDGVVVPITSCTLKLSISALEEPASAEEADYKLQKQGEIFGDPLDGQFKFSFESVDVDFVGDYFYDFEFTDAAGKTNTLAKDSWVMQQDIGK